jgi:hypothetical protein
MKEREIFEKLTPEPTTLLSLKLRPFSLGHLILLHRIESAFVFGGLPSYDDLALSVFICSRTYEEAVAGFEDPGLRREMRRWAKKVHGITWWRPNGKPIDLAEKWKLFHEYLNLNCIRLEAGKDYIADEENTRRVHLPVVHTVRVKLQSRMGFSDSEILNRPWSWCLFDYFVLADIADGIISMGHQEAAKAAISEAQAVAEKVLKKMRGQHGG